MRMRSVTGVLTAGVLLGLCGCGGGGTSAPAADGSGTYLGRTSNAVLFLQWTRSGGKVVGTLRESSQEPGGRGLHTGAHLEFSGLITGTSVTLLLPGGATLPGTLAREGFTLTVPSGPVESVTVAFLPGSAAQYEAARASLAASEYGSPCELWVEGQAVHLELSGAGARERCARLVMRRPAERWTTSPQRSAAEHVICRLSIPGQHEQVIVSDTGTSPRGAAVCRQLGSEGWR
jgi:hypothetical protein